MSTHAPVAARPANYMEGTTVRDGLRDIVDRETPRVEKLVADWLARGLEQLYLVGCGGSFATHEPPKWLADKYSTLPVDRYSAWEFVRRAPARLGARSAVVLGSHSGTTEEVLEALRLAKSRGATTVSFSQAGTPLTRAADFALTYNSPAANLSKLLLGYLIITELLVQRDHQSVGAELKNALRTLPEVMHTAIQRTEAHSRTLATQYRDAKNFYVIGTGLLAGLAYQFAICNILEMQWTHATSLNAAEFRHGPLEIVQPGLPMIFLLGADETRAETERAMEFSRRHGASIIAFDLKEIPGIHPLLAPFGVHLPLQWFNWYLGVERNHPVSTRRYMGKVPY
ncbi:MAG: SIS domain-containing protein [Chloroflexi bacterium]|nr:SIS domain-containing protein [Chloroflexota bacterium]